MPNLRISALFRGSPKKSSKQTPTAGNTNTDFFSPVSPSAAKYPAAEGSPKKGAAARYSVSSPTRSQPRGAWESKDERKEAPGHRDSNNRRHRLRKPQVPLAWASSQVERCSRCTKEEMWVAYDVFRNMDKRRRNKIGRIDFVEALKDYPTLEKLKMLKRSQLESRFRESANDVSLDEFLRLLWPSATDEDITKMLRWAQLREAQAVLRDDSFRGETSELRRVFDLLDENGDTMLSVNELQRAQIFTQKEIFTLMFQDRPDATNDTKLSFADFCFYAQHHLKAMYVTADMQKVMAQEQEKNQNDELERSFRNMFAR